MGANLTIAQPEQGRQGVRLPRRPWAKVPSPAIFDRSLSDKALRVLATLACYSDRYGRAFPSITTLAKALGVSRRTIERAIAELETRGYVHSEKRPGRTRLRRLECDKNVASDATKMSHPCDKNDAGNATNLSHGCDKNVAQIQILEPTRPHNQSPTRADPSPATSDNGVEHRGAAPPRAPHVEARGEQGSPSTSPTPEPLEAHRPPPRGVLQRLEAAVAAAGDLDPDPDDESAVPFSTRAKLAARLWATSLGLLRHLERVDGLLYCLSIAVLGWPPPPAEGEALDEGEEPEERLRRWVDEVSKKARYSFEELREAAEEFYSLARAVRVLIACAAAICSLRPTIFPAATPTTEAIKILAGEAAGEAERLAGVQARQRWSEAAFELADALLVAERVRRRGSIAWRLKPRLTPDELVRLLPEAAAFVTALQSNGHHPETSGGE